MTTVVSVRFRSGCKTYFFDPKELTVETGQDVIVETAQGPEFAQCSQGNHEVPDQQVVQPLRAVLRIATDNDRHTAAYNRGREKEAFEICQKKIAQHKLEMKLVRVECSFDGSKILFFFTADGRVDFRELVKDLAGVFRARIELRQIGVRDEAKMLGGLGICGRPFCCAQFMDEFLPVSIKMAKTQNLSLNPTKISGTCGRLMCCLKYEQDAYEDAVKRMPKNDSFVLTPDGPGNVSDVNLLKETVNVRLDDRTDGSRCYHNCEVCVLRNGKGSRDGIVIPDRRPERYVEPEKEDDMPPISFISDFTPPSEHGDEGGGEKRRRRNRSGRGGKKSEGAAAPEKRTEKSARPDKPAKAERPAKPDKPEKADRPAAGDKQSPRQGGSRRRGRRGGSGASAGANTSADITNTPPAAPRPPRKPQPEGQNGSGEQKKRPRHRGGRRRGGSGGNKPTSGSEV
ncbi:MAG: stage 0 sporulation family protein [Oscillospiraceae bacterium]|nr:stage 0 sporulation family protein [Oscillospiraceae bacterium]